MSTYNIMIVMIILVFIMDDVNIETIITDDRMDLRKLYNKNPQYEHDTLDESTIYVLSQLP